MNDRRRIWLMGIVFVLIFAFGAGYSWVFSGLPSLESLPDQLNAPSVRITDRFGRTLYEALPEEGGRHTVVDLESIPLALQQATIATEDANFYSHPGVDLRAIVRALWIDLRASLREGQLETPSGGSTITQQVARNLLLSEEERSQRSLRRKLRESALAWQLTRSFSKDEILALYINQTYYGGLAYGAEAASQTFFGKPVSELDLAESALLAGLPQSPAVYNPLTAPENAQARQAIVLDLMQKADFIDEEQRSLAEREELIFASTAYPIEAPHFVMMVRSQLDALFSPEEIAQHGGLQVRTTLDLDWQRHAERSVERHLEELSSGEFGLGHNVNNAALIAMDTQTGEIMALVGSPDYFDPNHGGAINMALSPRQPGSALKPILYSAALDPENTDSQPWTAATMLLDVDTAFVTQDGKAYTPSNYDQQVHGPVLIREALASSLNIPAVIALDHVGLDRLFTQATKMGITTLEDPQRYDLTLALGGGEVRLIELTAAYGAFANGGFRLTPSSILEVSDFQGNLLYSTQTPAEVRVLDERLAWLISDILSDNDARIMGFGEISSLRLDRPAAVKTGTTSNFHDNWTVGYTPELVTGVWVGNTSYEPMRDVNGLSGAAPIWHSFTRTVLTGQAEQAFSMPQGIERVEVCAISGLLPTPTCPYRRWEWFITGTEPTQLDAFYQLVTIDAATGALANDNTPLERRIDQLVLDLPPEAIPWAHAQGLTLLSDLTSGSGGGPVSGSPLRLVSPASGSVYYINPGLDPETQKLLIESVVDGDFVEVSLWIDGERLGVFDTAPFQVWWGLAVGAHEAWVEGVREDGDIVMSARVTFEVRE
jgi:penicillin-binding protein 1C